MRPREVFDLSGLFYKSASLLQNSLSWAIVDTCERRSLSSIKSVAFVEEQPQPLKKITSLPAHFSDVESGQWAMSFLLAGSAIEGLPTMSWQWRGLFESRSVTSVSRMRKR